MLDDDLYNSDDYKKMLLDDSTEGDELLRKFWRRIDEEAELAALRQPFPCATSKIS
jgi:hypothetical protein